MLKGLLPIGSVVVLADSSKKVMIVGVGQIGDRDNRIWDYAGVLFPEGYLDADTMFLFDHGQIEELCFLGCQDPEQRQFKALAEETLTRLRRQ